MNRLFIALLISSLGTLLLLAAGTMPAAAQETYTATPVADTYTRVQFPDTNYGLSTQNFVRSQPSNQFIKAYIQFDIPDQDQVVSATLQTYWLQSVSVDLYATYSGWEEQALTWNNAPPDIGYVTTFTTAVGWNETDISGLIRDGYAIAMTSNYTINNAAFLFRTRETALSPSVEYKLAPTAVPPPAEPQLIHCYDFDTDPADFFGGPAWTVPVGATYDGSVSTGLNQNYSGGVTGQSIEIWATDVNEIEIATGTGDIYAEPEQSGHVVVVVGDSSADVYHNGVLLESISGPWGGSFSSVAALSALSIDQILVWDGAIDPAARYVAGARPCVDQLDPTAVVISQQLISLPSGGLARVDMTATAGELFVTGVLLMLVFIGIWQAVERLANFNSKR